MNCPVPADIKIYHIVHIDKLASIIRDGSLWSDAKVHQRNSGGTTIGMPKIKERRMNMALTSYPNLHVGECVPFYFCPRSVMLYMFYMKNHDEISYKGGQEPILHLVADFRKTINWANANSRRWVFTNSNAGSRYFNDYNGLNQLDQIDWNAVNNDSWKQCREKKQAEFLIEDRFPWDLIETIGVYSKTQLQQTNEILAQASYRPSVKIMREWYY